MMSCPIGWLGVGHGRSAFLLSQIYALDDVAFERNCENLEDTIA